MARRTAINGFGRIGRLTFRALWVKRPDEIEVVAINDPTGAKTDALLLEFDSNYGRFPATIQSHQGHIQVDDTRIRVLHERDWTRLNWASLGVHTVLECSGAGTTRERAQAHLNAGARLVIISAPARGDDATLVMGVNHGDYRPGAHAIVSNGSCTTNCLAPVALVLEQRFGIKWGMLSTIHSYTNSQNIHDRAMSDPRMSRAGALNIIPTDTGAARALGRVIPALQGRFDGMAFRVPTPTVSAVDFVCETARPVHRDDVIAAFRAASEDGPLKGILGVSDRPLVSMDFKGDERSAIVDLPSTIVLASRIVKVVAWYDNEWGYACRLADLAVHTARADHAYGIDEAASVGLDDGSIEEVEEASVPEL
ncbi:MAG: type I glyceraldehyde-3-phosphate dehydrogenase [Chloroflexota bacterium]|nr:MAG: type I glyceraldehyde-3-phosphate dehydrogenase [Chloroflexota bacterium]